jgi:hypothetical protein
MDERKKLNGITLELHKNAKRYELRGMLKIEDKEIWTTVPVDSRELFDNPPKDILKTIVMGCTRTYFYTHVDTKDRRHELKDIESDGQSND